MIFLKKSNLLMIFKVFYLCTRGVVRDPEASPALKGLRQPETLPGASPLSLELTVLWLLSSGSCIYFYCSTDALSHSSWDTTLSPSCFQKQSTWTKPLQTLRRDSEVTSVQL